MLGLHRRPMMKMDLAKLKWNLHGGITLRYQMKQIHGITMCLIKIYLTKVVSTGKIRIQNMPERMNRYSTRSNQKENRCHVSRNTS